MYTKEIESIDKQIEETQKQFTIRTVQIHGGINMTDFYGNEIQIGDKCVVINMSDYLERVTVLEITDEQSIKVINSFDEESYHFPNNIIDIEAIERKVYSERIINSVKTLSIEDNDTVTVSLVPNQLSMNEPKRVFDQLKKAFPNNRVVVTIGLDVDIEKGDSNV